MPVCKQKYPSSQRIGHILQIGRIALYFLLFFLPGFTQASEVAIKITQTADEFIRLHLESLVEEEKISRFDYHLGKIDPRLTLQDCEAQDMSIRLISSPLRSTRNSLEVSCLTRWKIILQARIDVRYRALTAKLTLRRNQIITESDIEYSDLPANKLRYGYYQKPEELVGLVAKRSVLAGQPVTPNHIKSPLLVSKGDNVVISAKSDILNVRMAGTAMSNGSQGDQVLVRNNKSQRVVKAYVVERGIVEVPL